MGYDQGGYSAPREFRKATCAECTKKCEVLFKLKGDRPVYCKACFNKRKAEGR